MEFPNFNKKCKKYERSSGCVKKQGIIYFCGIPASYISYQIFNRKKKLPTLEVARANSNSIARSYDSFRPDMYKKLKKTKVYPADFYFKNKILLYVDVFDDTKTYTFYYTPLI